MNKLYYVVLRSFRNNDCIRMLVTISHVEEIKGQTVEVYVSQQFEGTDYKIVRSDFVCKTDEILVREV